LPVESFNIHGVSVRLVGLDEGPAAALVPQLDRWLGWAAADAPAAEADFRIELSPTAVIADARLAAMRRREPFFHHAHSDLPQFYGRYQVTGFRDGDFVLLDFGRFGHVCFDYAERSVRAHLPGEAIAGPGAGLHTAMMFFLEMPVYWALASRGLFALHAAGVRVHGTTWLLSAGTRSGKTTTVVALVQAGGEFLGDDWVLLRRDGGGVVAHSFPCWIGLRRPSLRWFADLAALGEPAVDGTDKLDLDPRLAWPGRLLDAAVPDALLRPTIVGGPVSESRPLSRLDALHRLMEDNLSLTHPAMAEAFFEILVDLAEQAPAHELRLGDDPLAVAEALAKIRPGDDGRGAPR